jgi:hypothetical protein
MRWGYWTVEKQGQWMLGVNILLRLHLARKEESVG